MDNIASALHLNGELGSRRTNLGTEASQRSGHNDKAFGRGRVSKSTHLDETWIAAAPSKPTGRASRSTRLAEQICLVTWGLDKCPDQWKTLRKTGITRSSSGV